MADAQGPWIDTNPGPRNADRRQRDSLFCMPCKGLGCLSDPTSLINASKPVKVCHIFHRYRENLSNVFGKCLYLHEQI